MVGFEVLEHICSRLCHDLAGPIGAIRNGLELIEESRDEGGDSGVDQALDLIGHSAEQAARRLRLFRLAYGRAIRVGTRSFAETREAALDWLAGSRVSVEWLPSTLDDSLAARPGVARLLLNLVMLAADAIPVGGVIVVAADGGSGISVRASGRGVKWPPEIAAALITPPSGDGLGPRTIHAAMTGRIAACDRLTISWEAPDPNTLAFSLAWDGEERKQE